MDLRGPILMLLGIFLVLATVLGLGQLNPAWQTTAQRAAPLIGVIAFIGLIVLVVFGRE